MTCLELSLLCLPLLVLKGQPVTLVGGKKVLLYIIDEVRIRRTCV